MEAYKKVFDNNRAWVDKLLAQDPQYFERMTGDQTPEFLYIGCSDSRVPAETIMGLSPGQIFVHRNIANLVVNTDDNCQSVIHYAVNVLKVKHIVVCGHYGCGGVKAAMEPRDFGMLNGWLREIRDIYHQHRAEFKLITDPDARHRRLVEKNVLEQCTNVIKTMCVQKSFAETGYPYVHGWAYDLGTGLINDLHIDYQAILNNLQEIYDLHPPQVPRPA
jgi:carbonic anhydrase